MILEVTAYGIENNGDNLIDIIVEDKILETVNVNETVSVEINPGQEVKLESNSSDKNPFKGWKSIDTS